MSTTTTAPTFQTELNKCNLNNLADLLRAMKLGNFFQKVKVVVTALTAATAVDITAAATKAAAVVTGITLDSGEMLPPIRNVVALRVVGAGGGNKPGAYVVFDDAGTPYDAGATSVGVATLSDDGKTITFLSQVTAFTLIYEPRSFTDLTGAYPA